MLLPQGAEAPPTRGKHRKQQREGELRSTSAHRELSPATQRQFNIGWWPPGKFPSTSHQRIQPPNKPERKIQSIGNGRRVGSVEDGERRMGESRENREEKKEKEWEEGTHKVIENERGTER